MDKTFLALALMSGALLSACGSDAATQQEVVAEPAHLQSEAGMTSTVPAGCPPGAPNEKGVGGFCTKGGRQCRGTAAPVCSVDGSRSAPVAFCTRPCATDDNCGSGAVCMRDPAIPVLKGCVPKVCLE